MPWHPPTVLLGQSQEVTSVCWCPSDFTKVCKQISVAGLKDHRFVDFPNTDFYV